MRLHFLRWVAAALLVATASCFPLLAQDGASQTETRSDAATQRVQIGGVFPHITVMAPGAGSDSETGIGALIPWADRLWAIGYVAHVKGAGIGLY